MTLIDNELIKLLSYHTKLTSFPVWDSFLVPVLGGGRMVVHCHSQTCIKRKANIYIRTLWGGYSFSYIVAKHRQFLFSLVYISILSYDIMPESGIIHALIFGNPLPDSK